MTQRINGRVIIDGSVNMKDGLTVANNVTAGGSATIGGTVTANSRVLAPKANRTYVRTTADTTNHTTETEIAPASGPTLKGVAIPGADGTKRYACHVNVTVNSSAIQDVTIRVYVGLNGTKADTIVAMAVGRFSSAIGSLSIASFEVTAAQAIANSKMTVTSAAGANIADLGSAGATTGALTSIEIMEVTDTAS